jgi:hypothetical protein
VAAEVLTHERPGVPIPAVAQPLERITTMHHNGITATGPEEWRDVVGWEGLYEVSSLGRVRSLDREIVHYRGGLARRKGRVLSASPDSDGYPMVHLYRDGARTSRLVHALVCPAFHGPRPFPAAEVLHADETRTNCAASNLAWGSHKANMRQAYESGRVIPPHARSAA